MFIVRTNYVMR